ncbi:MAG TPA: hypothetical protein VGD78_08605 [Chthoniobacterales bacterium]
MKALRVTFFGMAALAALTLRAEDVLDRVDEAATFDLLHDQLRLRFSGLIDLEFYHFDPPAPGLINAGGRNLLNPRSTLFLDAQLGAHVYAFAQARFDQGFDPSDRGARLRLDEYAIRFTPWENGSVNLQVGKFATVVGNWVQRHHSWDNPFVTAPLPYENVTAASDSEPPDSPRAFLGVQTRQKYEHNPIVWGPDYTTGLSVAGGLHGFEYAAEVTNATLASRPQSWSLANTGFSHPAFAARFGYQPNPAWRFGFSVSDGPYLRTETGGNLPLHQGIGDYHERVLSQDLSFASHHLQLWAEFYEARFEIPRIGNADTFAYYLEAKYQFTPQLFGGLRWNQQLFSTVQDGEGGRAPWGHDTWRVDASLGYRFTAHTQLKLQFSLQDGAFSSTDLSHLLAAQFTIRF